MGAGEPAPSGCEAGGGGDLLPANLGPFAVILGPAALLALVEAFGGRRIYVPKRARYGQVLSASLGIEAARALSDAFGGGQIKVPMCKAWRARVYAARALSTREIGRRLGLSEASVLRLLGTRRADPARTGPREARAGSAS